MKPPLPKNEAHRLNVLWQYDILDTVPEEVFDELAELAGHICEAPIALITLVDEKRQWFKARVGTSVKETSRDISFCAHAIMQNELFIIADASKDPRFKKNPMVVGQPKIRFYAGAPLKSPDGYALGTLCVVDSKPRILRDEQKKSLHIISHIFILFAAGQRNQQRENKQDQGVFHHAPKIRSFKAWGKGRVHSK